MCFTCSAQDCEKNQANHFDSEPSYDQVGLEQSVTRCIYSQTPLSMHPPSASPPTYCHKIPPIHPQICPLLLARLLPGEKKSLSSLYATFLLPVNKWAACSWPWWLLAVFHRAYDIRAPVSLADTVLYQHLLCYYLFAQHIKTSISLIINLEKLLCMIWATCIWESWNSITIDCPLRRKENSTWVGLLLESTADFFLTSQAQSLPIGVEMNKQEDRILIR